MGLTDSANAHRFRSVNRATAARLSGSEHPVLFFNASTRLNRTSLNAAYADRFQPALFRRARSLHQLR